jgi:hypothetical protein
LQTGLDKRKCAIAVILPVRANQSGNSLAANNSDPSS